jgi:hypothetical protein
MKNTITNWQYEPPTELGLYLVCRGDVETIDNIEAFRMVEPDRVSPVHSSFEEYSVDYVATWKGRKFARLCIGSQWGA